MGVFDVRRALARAILHSSPHAPRFEVLQRPFSRSLRGRLTTPILRRRESSSHCVYGLGLSARAANPHREHRTCPFTLIDLC
jgi:hypothetical protein